MIGLGSEIFCQLFTHLQRINSVTTTMEQSICHRKTEPKEISVQSDWSVGCVQTTYFIRIYRFHATVRYPVPFIGSRLWIDRIFVLIAAQPPDMGKWLTDLRKRIDETCGIIRSKMTKNRPQGQCNYG